MCDAGRRVCNMCRHVCESFRHVVGGCACACVGDEWVRRACVCFEFACTKGCRAGSCMGSGEGRRLFWSSFFMQPDKVLLRW